MNFEQLQHLLRASSDIVGDDQFIVIGSQSILGKFPNAPEALLWSTECDLIKAPERIIGFYALAIRAMTPKGDIPPALARRLPRDVPGYTLGRLAIEKAWQGRGLGADLMVDAMARVRLAAEQVGGYAFFVDAKDADAAAFYTHFGFQRCRSDPLTLFMPIAHFPPV